MSKPEDGGVINPEVSEEVGRLSALLAAHNVRNATPGNVAAALRAFFADDSETRYSR